MWLARADWRLAAILEPAPVLFILFLGSQDRYFARWLLPIYPIVCLLAAYAGAHRRRGGRAAPAAAARGAVVAACLGLLAQAVIYTVHSDRVLARDDTRGLTRAWMVKHIPAGTKIVVEPVSPDQWAQDPGNPIPVTPSGNRWIKFRTSRSQVNNDGTIRKGKGRIVNVEDYERTTRPQLIHAYEAGRYCWVISGSTQSGRAFAQPKVVPNAIAYYKELGRRAKVVYRASPYGEGKGPVKFNFDWSFDFYPLAYERPGPEMTVYRLTGGRCAGPGPPSKPQFDPCSGDQIEGGTPDDHRDHHDRLCPRPPSHPPRVHRRRARRPRALDGDRARLVLRHDRRLRRPQRPSARRQHLLRRHRHRRAHRDAAPSRVPVLALSPSSTCSTSSTTSPT